MTKSIEDLIDKVDEKQGRINRFSDLLDELENTEDKKKYLWKEIYENAINDREKANILFTDLLIDSKGNTANHTIYGPIMSKYLERMSKSNDQILRLAEIISKEEQSPVDPNLIFDQIGG
jgi:hypothetical protein